MVEAIGVGILLVLCGVWHEVSNCRRLLRRLPKRSEWGMVIQEDDDL